MGGDAMLGSRYAETWEWAQKALDLAEQLDRPDLQVRPLQYRAWARFDSGDVENALADMRAAIELGQRLGRAPETALGYNNYAGMRWATEGPAAGLETFGEGIAFTGRRGLTGMRAWSQAESTYILFELGRWDELVALAHEVYEIAREHAMPQPETMAQPWEAQVLALRGSAAEAARLTAAGLPVARRVGDPQLTMPMLQAEGVVQALLGNQGAVIDALLESERVIAETTGMIASFMTDLVRLAVGTGDLELARRLLDANPEPPGRGENVAATGRVLIAEAEGQVEEALEGFRNAADRWGRYGHVIEQGRALVGVGRCLVALGRSGEAVEPLRQARELFTPPGATVLLGEVDDVLAQTRARAG
jgi:tetratricopeptide (TPR) repeat protein